jgi:hypothetical protein
VPGEYERMNADELHKKVREHIKKIDLFSMVQEQKVFVHGSLFLFEGFKTRELDGSIAQLKTYRRIIVPSIAIALLLVISVPHHMNSNVLLSYR